MIQINFTKKQVWHIVIDLVLLAMVLPSCMSEQEYKRSLLQQFENSVESDCKLVDITFDGETHQYILYRTGTYVSSENSTGSLSHWAGCKYCKHHNNGYIVDTVYIYREPEVEDNSDDWLYK